MANCSVLLSLTLSARITMYTELREGTHKDGSYLNPLKKSKLGLEDPSRKHRIICRRLA